MLSRLENIIFIVELFIIHIFESFCLVECANEYTVLALSNGNVIHRYGHEADQNPPVDIHIVLFSSISVRPIRSKYISPVSNSSNTVISSRVQHECSAD